MSDDVRVATLRLTAVRHGETTLNAAGLLTGQRDPPLTADGHGQARALAARLAGCRFDVIVHSGSRRTAETLRPLRLGTARSDARWRERSFGALEGQPSSAWEQPHDVDAAPPGGESYRRLGRRVHAALADLHVEATARSSGLAVLLCAHSGVLRVLAAIAAEADDVASLLGPPPDNAEVAEFTYAAVRLPPLFASAASGGRSSTGTSHTAPPAQG